MRLASEYMSLLKVGHERGKEKKKRGTRREEKKDEPDVLIKSAFRSAAEHVSFVQGLRATFARHYS